MIHKTKGESVAIVLYLVSSQSLAHNAKHVRRCDCMFPLQVNLWGLDAIKTKGESVAIVLYLVGARPLREATGRVARYELIPLEVTSCACTMHTHTHTLTCSLLSS